MIVFFNSLIVYKIKYSRLNKTKSDFWLDVNDKNEYLRLSKQLDEAITKKVDAKRKAQNEGVSVNLDGRFSAKSYVGKEMQQIIDENNLISEKAYSRLDILSSKPRKRWNELKNIYGKLVAFSSSIIVYLATSIFVSNIDYFNLSMKKILGFGYYIYLGLTADKIKIFKYFGEGHFIYGMILVTVLSYGSYLLIKSDVIARYLTKKVSPEPPMVELENLNDF